MEDSHVDRTEASVENSTRVGRRRLQKNITLRRPIIAYAEEQAGKRGQSFSAFVEHLIEKHQESS